MCTENYWPDINPSLYTNALEKMVQKSCEEFLQQILGWKMNVPNIRDYSLKSKQRHHMVILSLFGFLTNSVVRVFPEEDL